MRPLFQSCEHDAATQLQTVMSEGHDQAAARRVVVSQVAASYLDSSRLLNVCSLWKLQVSSVCRAEVVLLPAEEQCCLAAGLEAPAASGR